MRRKNRQLKITLDIPENYGSDEDFMQALMEKMDEDGGRWALPVDNHRASISKIAMGGIEIEPEEGS